MQFTPCKARACSNPMRMNDTPEVLDFAEVPERQAAVSRQLRAAERLGVGPHFRDTLDDGSAAPWMSVIPEGSFFMGSGPEEYAREDCEGPRHAVDFPRPFAIGRYAITRGEYYRFVDETGRHRPRRYGWVDPALPVYNVTFEDARAYAGWLSQRTGQHYRLPTEAEWEYAARAGTTTAFAYGDKIHREEVNCAGGFQCTRGLWFCGLGRPLPVGNLPPNAWGVHEMHGNVQEFVQDHWRDRYSPSPRDGREAWVGSRTRFRVVRGGSWFDKPGACRSAARARRQTGEFDLNLGFRLVREFLP